MAEPNKDKGWTPEELEKFIGEKCGAAVALALEPLQKRITDHAGWIDASKAAITNPAAARTDLEKGLIVGGVLAAMAMGKGDKDKAIAFAKNSKQDAVVKALEASTEAGGGALIPEDYSSDFIDLLTPRAVVRSFGTPVVPMASGSMIISGLASAATAYYQGEARPATKSQQAFKLRRLNARKLTALVPVSNDLIRRGGPRVNSIVRNDTLRSIVLKEDVTFIRGTGTEFAPKGLRYQANAANVIPWSGAVSLTTVTQFLGQLVLALEEANVPFTNPGWMFSPRTKQYLMTVRDGLGNYAFRAEMLTGKFWGWPFKTTTQIPRNLGGGADESEIYLVDFDDVVIGQVMNLDIAMSTEASYTDENGNSISAFESDQTLMRVITEHDILARHDLSIGIGTEITWSPTV